MSSTNPLSTQVGELAVYSAEATGQKAGGIQFPRHFTHEGVSPYDDIEWETRTASIANEKGEILFEQKEVEIPKNWSQTATNIVVSKYFHGQIGTPQREKSVRQLVGPRRPHSDGMGAEWRLFRLGSRRAHLS